MILMAPTGRTRGKAGKTDNTDPVSIEKSSKLILKTNFLIIKIYNAIFEGFYGWFYLPYTKLIFIYQTKCTKLNLRTITGNST